MPSAEHNLSPSICATHQSCIHMKETGGFISYLTAIMVPFFLCLQLSHEHRPFSTSLGGTHFNVQMTFIPSSCLLFCWVQRQTCGMFFFFSVLSTIQLAAVGIKIELSALSAGVVLMWGICRTRPVDFFLKLLFAR